MSTYFGMSAIVVGETSVIRKVHALVVEDETRQRSDSFRCKEVQVGREGFSAILYRAGSSRRRPASVGTLCSQDANRILTGREVCEYLYCFAESGQDEWNECEFRGVLVAKGCSMDSSLSLRRVIHLLAAWFRQTDKRSRLTKVDRVFEQKCRELGVDGAALLNDFLTEEDGEDPRGPDPMDVTAEMEYVACTTPISYWDDPDIPF